MPALFSNADKAETAWRSQAPALLSQYQSVDIARLRTIKEVRITMDRGLIVT